jgi:23S rRNA (cytosine1962-C5)-methyltransferase
MIPNRDKWARQAEMLANRVKKNERKLRKWRKTQQVGCYRMYHLDIPELPLLIDWYEGKLHISTRHKPHNRSEQCIDFLAAHLAEQLGVAKSDVFIKHRKLGRGGSQYPALSSEGRILEVKEGGHKFLVNLSDYLDTGLFLDHRITRQMVQREAAGKRFVNLFAYTGSFTVYAAAGGARSTTTIDLSKTYLNVAKKNMKHNGFMGSHHRFIKQDVLGMLHKKNMTSRFDLAVMDAPTVSRSKAMNGSLVIQNDYVWMLNALLQSISPGGVIYFSCNLSDFEFDKQAVRASEIVDITEQTIPPDFKAKCPHKCFRLVK